MPRAPSPLAFCRKHSAVIRRMLRCLIVFTIPVLTGLVFFVKREIYPFGENSLLSIDLWGQYFPMFRQFSQTDTLSEALYSWNGALGYNNFVQSAFYCHSPFLLLLNTVSLEWSIHVIDVVCLLRLGLSAVTCLLLLEHKFQKPQPLLMGLSVSYGLCAYGIAYIMQFMWTDLFVLAPLVLLGLERLLEGRSPLLYVMALAASIYINFYVAFGVCLFTACYFVAELIKCAVFERHRLTNVKQLACTAGRFALYSVLAGLFNAFTLIPTLLGLSLTSSASLGTVDFTQWYHTLADNLSAMLPQAEISLGYGTANIAVGLCVFVLLPLYFLNTSVRFRDKLTSGGLLLLLYGGLNFNPLDYVFNGFHFPNQLPGRWSFLFSLLILLLAAEGLTKLEGIRPKSIVSACIAGVFFLLMAKYSDDMSEQQRDCLIGWIVFLIIFSLCLLLYTLFQKRAAVSIANKRRGMRIAAAVSCLAVASMMTVQVCRNAVDVACEEGAGIGTSSMTHYLNATWIFSKYGDVYDSGDTELYRTENNEGWTFNDGQLGGYKAIGYYGSTMNGRVYELLRAMGNRVYTLNISSLYNNSSTVQNGLFGVRYFIDRGQYLDKRLSGIQQVAAYDDAIIWENPTALPIVFAAANDVRDLQLPETLCPIVTQNEFVNALCGQAVDVFEKQVSAFSEPTSGEIRYTYICRDDKPVYFEQHFQNGTMKLKVGDTETEVFIGTEPFKYVGCYPAGTRITVTVTNSSGTDAADGVDFYRLDTDKWQAVYNTLNSGGMTVTSFDCTEVKGTMTVDGETTVFTSIPQDGGWCVYVDGKRVEDFLIASALIGFELEAGTHEITFRYRVPGLALGLAVSVIAAAAIVFCIIYKRKRAQDVV